MKRPVRILLLRLCVAAPVTAFFFYLAQPTVPVLPAALRSELREREDPSRRDSYEWLRLHDPATGTIPEGIRTRELALARTLPTTKTLRNELRKRGLDPGILPEISWTQRGPSNIGGRTRAFAADVTNAQLLLAGGVSGGMWRSTNGGLSWAKSTTPDQLHSVTCLTQDTRPGRTNIWYYGTGELRGNSASGGGGALYRGDGVFKSVDGGQHWVPLASTVTGIPGAYDQMFDYVWNIVTNPASQQDEVYAATIGGVMRSTDGGTTWQVALGGPTTDHSRYTDVAVTSQGVLYATMSDANLNGASGSVSQGLWRSVDGISWVDIRPANPPWPPRTKRIVIGIAPSDESVVYFLGETPGYGKRSVIDSDEEWNSFWKYRYVSGAGSGSGGTWEDRSSNLPGFGGPVGDFYSQGSYNLAVKVSPDNDSLVYIGSTNLYRTSNGLRTAGATAWIGGYSNRNDISQYPGHHCDQHVLFFDQENPAILYSGNDGGVFVTRDCRAPTVLWESLNNGYFTAQFYTLAIDESTPGNNVIVGGTQDNSTLFVNSPDGRSPWLDVLFGDGAFCAIAGGRSSYYVSAQEGLTYRLLLTSTGQLTNYARVDPQGGSGYLFINPFSLDPSNNAVMYLSAGSSLWRNSNLLGIPLGGTSPSSVNWGRMTGVQVGGASISALGVSRSSPRSRLYLGTTDGQVFRLDGADVAPAGTIPVDVWTGKNLPTGAYVSAIAADPANGDRAMLVFSNYGVRSLFFTANGGASWTDVSGNLEENPDGSGSGPSVRWAAIQTYGGGPTYFVGTSTGLYSTRSLNGAATVWVQEGESAIGRVVVDMIAVRSLDGLVAAGTHGQGVFTGFAMPGDSIPPAGPMLTDLEAVFPNPFAWNARAFATVRFTLEEPGMVGVEVFDLGGRRVALLVDEWREAGRQPDVYWYPRNPASGVYFVRLRTSVGSIARKLVVVK